MVIFSMFSWPRASSKQRFLAAAFGAMFIFSVIQQWPHRLDDFALARWIAWFLIVTGVWFGTSAVAAAMFGRLPKTWARIFDRPDRLRMTPSQLHNDIKRELEEARARTRTL